MYAQDRFYRNWMFHRGADGQLRNMEQFTYESHSSVYDVLLFEGSMFVRENCGPLSCFISKWKPAHYAIASHFELDKAGYRCNTGIHA